MRDQVFFGKTVNNLLLPQKGSIIDIWQALNTEAVAQGYFIKKVFLQNFGKFTGKKPVLQSLEEETLAQVLSCEI